MVNYRLHQDTVKYISVYDIAISGDSMATIDLTQVVNLLQQLLPLIIVFALLPMIFRLIEKFM